MGRKVYLGTNLINDTYVGLDKTNLPSTRIVLASYVVAAGGGGGGVAGGGGGAGEVATNYLTGSTFPLIAANYTVTVGDGGLGGAYITSSKPIVDNLNLGSGSNGYSSSIVSNLNAIYAEGGGGGSGIYSTASQQPTGSDGGSGGGSYALAPGGTSTATAYGRDGGTTDSVGVPAYTGSYTGSAPSQSNSYKDIPGGGGGVFEATGSNFINSQFTYEVTDNNSHWFWSTNNDGASFSQEGMGGFGGEPLTVDYNPYNSGEVGAGGGGGGAGLTNSQYLDGGQGGGNTGGNGGGNINGQAGYNPAKTGSAYSGAGGGGGAFIRFFGNPFYFDGADGGSGIVVIKYELPQKYEGGELYYSGSDVLHVFTASGELTSII